MAWRERRGELPTGPSVRASVAPRSYHALSAQAAHSRPGSSAWLPGRGQRSSEPQKPARPAGVSQLLARRSGACGDEAREVAHSEDRARPAEIFLRGGPSATLSQHLQDSVVQVLVDHPVDATNLIVGPDWERGHGRPGHLKPP